MRRKLALNSDPKLHLMLAAAAGLWITLFLIVVGPFDAAPLPISWRAKVMFVYGLAFFASYAVAIPVQNWWYHRSGGWELWQELSLYLLIFGSCLPLCFTYYTSGTINGDYPFVKFVVEVYLPTLLIMLPLLIFGRWYVNRLPFKDRRKKSEQIITSSEMKQWRSRIERLMSEGIYLDTDLTLKTMADRLGTNTSVLSRVINQGYGANFNDFVNTHRVEAVRRALDDGRHKTHTLPGIAQDCGFNSKATFNRAFKKHLKLSPSAYIQRLGRLK